MPIFSGAIVGLFGWLGSLFGAILSARIAMVAAAITTFGLITAALYTALTLLFAGLVFAMPVTGGAFSSLLWMVCPDNAMVCVAAVVAADTLAALYHWNLGALKFASGNLF